MYGTCTNGTMSYNWLDLGGGLQTTIDLLQPDCTQDCRPNSGQDVWYRYSYASRQRDSRNGTRDQCAVSATGQVTSPQPSSHAGPYMLLAFHVVCAGR